MIAISLIVLVIVLHYFFMILEMLLWDKPTGRRIFRLDPDFSAKTRFIAINQGLYNGILSTALLYSLLTSNTNFTLLLLASIVVAGIVGALTVKFRIFWVQAFPALLAGISLLAGL